MLENKNKKWLEKLDLEIEKNKKDVESMTNQIKAL